MNTHEREPHDARPIDAKSIEELRWQAQEQARRGEAGADERDLRIARALRRAPPVELPADFAVQVAALASAQARDAVAQTALEQRLLQGLGLVFALSAAVIVAWFGRGWLAQLAAVLPGGSGAAGWSVLAALCLIGNWAVVSLRRLHEAATAPA